MSVDDQIILPTWNDIRALDIKRSFLADGLYPEGELGQIFASAGVGKSTIEAQSCQAIGSGRRLWGRKTKQTHCGHYRS
jgi:RecA-family ATPase